MTPAQRPCGVVAVGSGDAAVVPALTCVQSPPLHDPVSGRYGLVLPAGGVPRPPNITTAWAVPAYAIIAP
jgi:hypothetical protein